MDTARDRFNIGQHVRMSEKAIAQGLQGVFNRRTGVVVGFPFHSGITGLDPAVLVRVHRDGDKSAACDYHMSFWESVE